MAVLSEILPSPMPRRGAPRLVGLAVLIGLLYYGKLFFVTVISALIISFILDSTPNSFPQQGILSSLQKKKLQGMTIPS